MISSLSASELSDFSVLKKTFREDLEEKLKKLSDVKSTNETLTIEIKKHKTELSDLFSELSTKNSIIEKKLKKPKVLYEKQSEKISLKIRKYTDDIGEIDKHIACLEDFRKIHAKLKMDFEFKSDEILANFERLDEIENLLEKVSDVNEEFYSILKEEFELKFQKTLTKFAEFIANSNSNLNSQENIQKSLKIIASKGEETKSKFHTLFQTFLTQKMSQILNEHSENFEILISFLEKTQKTLNSNKIFQTKKLKFGLISTFTTAVSTKLPTKLTEYLTFKENSNLTQKLLPIENLLNIKISSEIDGIFLQKNRQKTIIRTRTLLLTATRTFRPTPFNSISGAHAETLRGHWNEFLTIFDCKISDAMAEIVAFLYEFIFDVLRMEYSTHMETFSASFKKLIRDVIFSIIAIFPILQIRFNEIPQMALLCFNDLIFLTFCIEKCAVLPFKTVYFLSDFIQICKNTAKIVLEKQISVQKAAVQQRVAVLEELNAICNSEKYKEIQSVLKRILHSLRITSNVWREIVSDSTANGLIARIIEDFLDSLTVCVKRKERFPIEMSKRIFSVFREVSEGIQAILGVNVSLEELFREENLEFSESFYGICVHFCELRDLLAPEQNLKRMSAEYRSGKYRSFHGEELKSLVCGIYEDSQKRMAFIDLLE